MLEISVHGGCVPNNNDERWWKIIKEHSKHPNLYPRVLALQNQMTNTARWRGMRALLRDNLVEHAAYAIVCCLTSTETPVNSIYPHLLLFVSVIEVARRERIQPNVPQWLLDDYNQALNTLTRNAEMQFPQAAEELELRAVMSLLMLRRGFIGYMIAFTEHTELELSKWFLTRHNVLRLLRQKNPIGQASRPELL